MTFAGIYNQVKKNSEIQLAIQAMTKVFDLQKDIYLPSRKPDNPPVYINNCSNHPPTEIKQLTKLISKQLSDFSSNQ